MPTPRETDSTVERTATRQRASEAVESDPDARARTIEAQLTDDERFSLVISLMGPAAGLIERDPRLPADLKNPSAGYTPGVPRLGIPAIQSSDASMGITNPGYRPGDRGATAFPALIALGASFDPSITYAIGAAIGRQARTRGFNVQLAGGCNLMRDPRNGRNFEYFSEDPWHTAVLAAAQVEGIQSQQVISTLKHFSLNCNETNRHWLDAIIDPDAHRESDLLAFQIAIERSAPGAIMSGYNKINGAYASGNHHLLNDVLKGAWGYPGYVMSDWGATLSWDYAIAGLDQESGAQLDATMWGAEAFTDRLREAYANGSFPRARLSDMVRRILRSLFAVGVDRWGPRRAVDLEAHDTLALEGARRGCVLLENDGVLPLPTDKPLKIAVIGGHAQEGVISGTGSGAVAPVGGFANVIKIGGAGVMGKHRNLFLIPPSPLAQLHAALPNATLEFDPGYTAAEAALTARRNDLVILFGIRVEGEGFDNADLSLPWGQDAVIDAVTTVNANTIVVLQTGNPLAMPWRRRVRAILQAWYPGQAGARAIAEILTGQVNPSGRLPITFPLTLAQTPRPQLPGLGSRWGTPVTIPYAEGAEVGYRWFGLRDLQPMYAFGHGLSYTTFAYGNLALDGGDTITASFTVTNTGDRRGADVPQVYLAGIGDDRRVRLLGFSRVELSPGETTAITIAADPRVLARFDGNAWSITEGMYRIALGRSAIDHVLTGEVRLFGRRFGA